MHELARDFGQHIELGDLAADVDPSYAQPCGLNATLALAAQLDQLRERESGLGSIEAARAAGAEYVLQLADEHGHRLEGRTVDACGLRLALKRELLEIRVAGKG